MHEQSERWQFTDCGLRDTEGHRDKRDEENKAAGKTKLKCLNRASIHPFESSVIGVNSLK